MKSLWRISSPLTIAAIVAGLVVSGERVASAEEGLVGQMSARPIPCSLNQAQNGLVQTVVVRVAQADPCPNGHTCITYSCGGDSNTAVCCPRGYPYLSHCDCKCYEASPDCNSYTRCSQP